jgi:hypothetical protein
MKTIAIEAGDGVLRLPKEVRLSPKARLAVLVLEDDETGAEIPTLAEAGGAFDFLKEEPELYSDADLLPNRRNPRFGGHQ